jgi:hypothetical protein
MRAVCASVAVSGSGGYRRGDGQEEARSATGSDRVVRESAGTYRTEDGRFELRQGGVGWYLVDLERTNELGQELLHGPFGTLKERATRSRKRARSSS